MKPTWTLQHPTPHSTRGTNKAALRLNPTLRQDVFVRVSIVISWSRVWGGGGWLRGRDFNCYWALPASPLRRCRWGCLRWAWRRKGVPDTWGRWSVAPAVSVAAWRSGPARPRTGCGSIPPARRRPSPAIPPLSALKSGSWHLGKEQKKFKGYEHMSLNCWIHIFNPTFDTFFKGILQSLVQRRIWTWSFFKCFWRASTWFHNNRNYNGIIYIIDNVIVPSDLVESSG